MELMAAASRSTSSSRSTADAAKADTTRKAWVPAVNASRQFGRWDFMEYAEAAYDVDKRIRERMRELASA